jgi:hypothetical protein
MFKVGTRGRHPCSGPRVPSGAPGEASVRVFCGGLDWPLRRAARVCKGVARLPRWEDLRQWRPRCLSQARFNQTERISTEGSEGLGDASATTAICFRTMHGQPHVSSVPGGWRVSAFRTTEGWASSRDKRANPGCLTASLGVRNNSPCRDVTKILTSFEI